MKVWGDFLKADTQHRQNNSDNQSKKGSKDQEWIQSSTTPQKLIIDWKPYNK